MLNGLFGKSVDNIQESLDRTAQRQSMLMRNLANANVPGYKREDMDFHIALDEASQAANMRSGFSQDSGATRADGSTIDMEKEITAIGETELRYSILTQLASRQFAGLKNVIREGR